MTALHEMFRCPQHAELLDTLALSHHMAAMGNDNTSSAVAVVTYKASGDMGKAIAAATLSQGGLHAPIAQARRLLEERDPASAAKLFLHYGQCVPGLGNSFYKTTIDPAFWPLYLALPVPLQAKIQAVRSAVPSLWPNAALITAAACIAANLPHGVEPAIFTYCRIPAWVKLCTAQ